MRRVLAIVVLLAVVRAALAAESEHAGRSALTLAISQGERGQFVVSTCSLERRLFADAADGRLDEFSPLGAALVAGGIEDADSLRRYEEKAAALVDELCRWATAHEVCLLRSGTPRERVEAIFEFMHRRVLRGGYDLACTDLRRALDDGRFNCISATVLFNYLAGQFGLDCRGLEMPGHAASRVVLSDGPLDVETTCPQWFSVSGTRRVSMPNVPGTRRVPVPHTACAEYNRSPHTACAEYKCAEYRAREVTPIQMAAMIYYNRGVDLLAEKRFAAAAAANAKALRLDPNNAVARGNLLATINNWSIELGNSGRFAEAVDLLRQGLTLDARFEAFALNYVHVHRQWVEHLCQAGHFEEATAILSRAAAEMPDRAYLRQAQSEVRERWARAVSAAPQSGLPPQFPCVKDAAEVD
jgi:tetratricopeptide (TPR) repeat protein